MRACVRACVRVWRCSRRALRDGGVSRPRPLQQGKHAIMLQRMKTGFGSWRWSAGSYSKATRWTSPPLARVVGSAGAVHLPHRLCFIRSLALPFGHLRVSCVCVLLPPPVSARGRSRIAALPACTCWAIRSPGARCCHMLARVCACTGHPVLYPDLHPRKASSPHPWCL